MKYAMENREQMEEVAAAWIFKRDSGEWTNRDETNLADWLAASTAHEVVFLRLDSVWREAARLKAVAAGIPAGTVPSHAEGAISKPTAGTPRPKLTLSRVLAACFLVAIVSAVAWYVFPHGPTYHTAIGGVAAVPMSDGSKVTLNTDSEIQLSVTETERRVNLEQGEAFFEVAKDPARPFIVTAGTQRVIAVGTKFSVRRDDGGVRVVVVEGRVRVDPGSGAGVEMPPSEVDAGDIARSTTQGVLVEKKALAEVETSLSWRSGFLMFRETPLADAIAEFNRYNEQKIVLEDPRLAAVHIDGNFRSTNVSAFVRLLEEGFPVSIERDQNQILVRAK